MVKVGASFVWAVSLVAAAMAVVAHPAPPIPPNWEPVVTRPGALAKGSGHLQGMCVTSNAIYGTLHDGLYKFDWYGRLVMHVSADKHQGDICFWNGKLYTAVCIPKNVPKRGRIDVWDENLTQKFLTLGKQDPGRPQRIMIMIPQNRPG